MRRSRACVALRLCRCVAAAPHLKPWRRSTMNDDQFNGTIPPGQWPAWLTAAVFGGLPAPWRSSAPSDIWDQSTPGNIASDRLAGRGILPDSFDRPPENAWPPALGGAVPNPA